MSGQAAIRIKSLAVELELASSEEHVKEQLPIPLAYIQPFLNQTVAVNSSIQQPGSVNPPSPSSKLGISSIAQKLASKSGSDLLTAACLSLTHAEKETCSRSEILAEMKKAKAYYKDSYASNLSNYLNTLIKDGTLLDQGNDTFALAANERAQLEAKLA